MTVQETASPDLSIIIVNHNTRDLLTRCIRSIYAETKSISFEIILVDNASTDDSVAVIREQFPEVRVITNTTNLGFPEANNQAIPLARGQYILLLNSDTVILDQALDRMVAFMNQHPEVGITGPKMYDAQMRPWRYETWFPSPMLYLLQPLLLHFWGDIGDKEVDWVCGACLMIRRCVIDQIGLLDTFMFGEDWDWCYRAKKAGWRIFHLSQAQIIHYWGATATAPEKMAGRVFGSHQAKLYYARKHFGKLGYLSLYLIISLKALIKLLFLAVQQAFAKSESAQELREQMVGYRRLLAALASNRILSEDKEWWKKRD
jgi:GT2 family glycosyltransferase